jgi:hypothetical protein
VGNVGPTDPVTAQALDLVRQLRSGQLKDDPRLSQTLDRLWNRAEEQE